MIGLMGTVSIQLKGRNYLLRGVGTHVGEMTLSTCNNVEAHPSGLTSQWSSLRSKGARLRGSCEFIPEDVEEHCHRAWAIACGKEEHASTRKKPTAACLYRVFQ